MSLFKSIRHRRLGPVSRFRLACFLALALVLPAEQALTFVHVLIDHAHEHAVASHEDPPEHQHHSDGHGDADHHDHHVGFSTLVESDVDHHADELSEHMHLLLVSGHDHHPHHQPAWPREHGVEDHFDSQELQRAPGSGKLKAQNVAVLPTTDLAVCIPAFNRRLLPEIDVGIGRSRFYSLPITRGPPLHG